jgi:hypothetical protein
VIPTFSLLHTTARLPNGWHDAAVEWLSNCDYPEFVEYVLYADGHITGMSNAPTNIQCDGFVLCGKAGAGHCDVGSANGWNRAAEASTGKFLITISDDYRPCEHWDTEILIALEHDHTADTNMIDGEYVLDVDNQDGAPHIPFSFLTRAYYNRYGYIFYPEYKGLMADNDFTDVAREDGVVINAKHLKFRHLHYLCGTAPNDEVYQKQQQTLAYGQMIYNRRCAERRDRKMAIATNINHNLGSPMNQGPHGIAKVEA